MKSHLKASRDYLTHQSVFKLDIEWSRWAIRFRGAWPLVGLVEVWWWAMFVWSTANMALLFAACRCNPAATRHETKAKKRETPDWQTLEVPVFNLQNAKVVTHSTYRREQNRPNNGNSDKRILFSYKWSTNK
eukprot:4794405-Amphidinium_carterae.1